jgi:hypothetical protein
MLTREHIHSFEDDGFVLGSKVLSDDQIVNIWQASAAFERRLHDSTVTSDVARLLDASELRVWHDQIQYKPDRTGGETPWHQDSPAWPPLGPKD